MFAFRFLVMSCLLTSCSLPTPMAQEPTPSPVQDTTLEVAFYPQTQLPQDRRGFLDISITHRGQAAALDNQRNVWISPDLENWQQVYTIPHDHPAPTTLALDPDFAAFFLGHHCPNACYSLVTTDGEKRLRDPHSSWVKHSNGETYSFPIHDAHWDRGIWVGLGEKPNRGGQVLSLPSPLTGTYWMARPLIIRSGSKPHPAFVSAIASDDSGRDYLGFWSILNAQGNQGYAGVSQWSHNLGIWLQMGLNQPEGDLPTQETPLSMGGRGQGRLAVLYASLGVKYQHIQTGIAWKTLHPTGVLGTPQAVALDPAGHLWLATDRGLFKSEKSLP